MKLAMELCKVREQVKAKHGHDSFDKYCKKVYGFSRQKAGRLITFYTVVSNLKSMGVPDEILPRSEWVLRPIKNLDPEQQFDAWLMACRSANGYPQHIHVLRASHRVQGLAPPAHYKSLGRDRKNSSQIEIDNKFLYALKIDASAQNMTPDELLHQYLDRIFDGYWEPMKRRNRWPKIDDQ